MKQVNYYKHKLTQRYKETNHYNTILEYLEIFLEQRKGNMRLELISNLLESDDYTYNLTKKLRKRRRRLANTTTRYHLEKLLENNLISKRPGQRYKQSYFITNNFNLEIFNIIKELLES